MLGETKRQAHIKLANVENGWDREVLTGKPTGDEGFFGESGRRPVDADDILGATLAHPKRPRFFPLDDRNECGRLTDDRGHGCLNYCGRNHRLSHLSTLPTAFQRKTRPAESVIISPKIGTGALWAAG